MKVVSIYELRDDLARYLNSVTTTETPIIVNRFGKPIAMITPYRKGRAGDISSFYGFMGKGETGSEYLKRVRRSKREKMAATRLRNRS